MNIAVLGTGDVGQRLASRLVELGHSVTLGSRTADNAKAVAWASESGGQNATFSDAAAGAELVLNATKGEFIDAVLDACGDHLDGKTLIDITNPLDFSQGFPPLLFTTSNDSIAEQIQRKKPAAKVVKALNMVANHLMVRPDQLPEDTDTFICGDDADAKAQVTDLLVSFGWKRERVRDVGGLHAARAFEHWLLMWTRLYGALGTANFNIRLVVGD